MRRGYKLLLIAACGVAFVLALSVAAYDQRYVRRVVIDDLSHSQTQTVSVTFPPTHLRWKLRGEIQGAGTVMISCVLSNRVARNFSIEGSGDYYETNASISFVPEGKTNGRIWVRLRFGDT